MRLDDTQIDSGSSDESFYMKIGDQEQNYFNEYISQSYGNLNQKFESYDGNNKVTLRVNPIKTDDSLNIFLHADFFDVAGIEQQYRKEIYCDEKRPKNCNG